MRAGLWQFAGLPAAARTARCTGGSQVSGQQVPARRRPKLSTTVLHPELEQTMPMVGGLISGEASAAAVASSSQASTRRPSQEALRRDCRLQHDGQLIGLETGRALFAQRGQALAHIRAGKSHEFKRQRGVKVWPGLAQPVVERVFCPADGALAARSQALGDLVGAWEQVRFVHRDVTPGRCARLPRR